MKKAVTYLGWILAGLFFIGMIYFAIPKNSTCDFRGSVEAVDADPQNKCVWLSVKMVFDETATKIKVNNNTRTQYHRGNKISADKIQVGDMVDLDVKQKTDHDFYEAKWVLVYPKNQ